MALLTADDNDDDEEEEIIEETDSDNGMYGNVLKYRFARFEKILQTILSSKCLCLFVYKRRRTGTAHSTSHPDKKEEVQVYFRFFGKDETHEQAH